MIQYRGGGDKMTDSILDSTKKLLGLYEDDNSFDQDVIMHINSAFFTLNQLGVGPVKGFNISDSSNLWTDYMPITNPELQSVKTYVYLKTRLAFDPPQSGSVLESINKQIAEHEWRLNITDTHK